MTKRTKGTAAGLLVCTLLLASATQLAALQQTPAQSAEIVVLKVDVVLMRSRTGESKDDPQLQNAMKSLERQEALFEKGLVNKQQVDAARLQVKQLQQVQTVSRLPYSLLVSPGQRTSLRIGVSVPSGQTSRTSEGVTTTERQYRQAGTNIDCSATAVGEGRFRIQLSVEDTSIVPGENVVTAGVRGAGDAAFRTMHVSNTLFLRDGQTLPFTVGTDRITGETLRAEVTLSVVK